MNLRDLTNASAVWIDANIFVYSFAPDPQWGPACRDLLERIERGQLRGVTGVNVVHDMAHRLMTLEACAKFGWQYQRVAWRLKRQPDAIRSLTQFGRAVEAVARMGIEIFAIEAVDVNAAVGLSQSYGLMSNDALITALMMRHGIVQIASHDADFDRVPDLKRFGPV